MRKWSEAFEDNGDVEDDYRSGRPRKLNSAEREAIIEHAEGAPKASTPRQIKHALNLSVSAKTIRRELDDAGLFGRIARQVPPLTDAHRKKRVSFAEGYSNMSWDTVLFSDEMSITVGPQGQTWVQRPIGEAWNADYCVEVRKHPPKMHVWGCFCYHGVGEIYVFEETLDALLMKKILAQCLRKTGHRYWPRGQWWFQQENDDPKHSSRLVQRARLAARGRN